MKCGTHHSSVSDGAKVSGLRSQVSGLGSQVSAEYTVVCTVKPFIDHYECESRHTLNITE